MSLGQAGGAACYCCEPVLIPCHRKGLKSHPLRLPQCQRKLESTASLGGRGRSHTGQGPQRPLLSSRTLKWPARLAHAGLRQPWEAGTPPAPILEIKELKRRRNEKTFPMPAGRSRGYLWTQATGSDISVPNHCALGGREPEGGKRPIRGLQTSTRETEGALRGRHTGDQEARGEMPAIVSHQGNLNQNSKMLPHTH